LHDPFRHLWLRLGKLPILAGIQPAELRRKVATLSLASRAMKPAYHLHSAPTRPSCADARRLKSRHQFVSAAQQLISSYDNNNIRVARWVDRQWNAEWMDNPTRFRTFILEPGTHSPRVTPPRRAWVRCNRLCTGVGRILYCLHKWRMTSSAA